MAPSKLIPAVGEPFSQVIIDCVGPLCGVTGLNYNTVYAYARPLYIHDVINV